VVRGSRLPPQMAAMSAMSPPPPCRPWDRRDLVRRLASFKAMTWFAKPKVHTVPPFMLLALRTALGYLLLLINMVLHAN
jgi:hypothetical protein